MMQKKMHPSKRILRRFCNTLLFAFTVLFALTLSRALTLSLALTHSHMLLLSHVLLLFKCSYSLTRSYSSEAINQFLVFFSYWCCCFLLLKSKCPWLSQMPQYICRRAHAASLWKKGTSDVSFDTRYDAAKKDGVNFSELYSEDVQFVLSRTNHHHHKLNKKGERVPLTACRLKTNKSQTQCTSRGTAGQDFFFLK